ncbi:MAG: hypothetical protein NVS9B15_03190 [Acidobacteriaceae bacterium]
MIVPPSLRQTAALHIVENRPASAVDKHLRQQYLHAAMNAKDKIDLALKAVALIVGGAWTVLNYFRGRTFTRRLEPALTAQIIELRRAKYLTGEASVKNVGLTKVSLTPEPTALVIYFVDTADGALSEEMVAAKSVFTDHAWIEPGELIREPFLHPLPAGSGDPLMVRLDLRLVSRGRGQKSIEWNCSAMVSPATREETTLNPINVTDGTGGIMQAQMNLQQSRERPDLSKMIEEQKKSGGPQPQKDEDEQTSAEIEKQKGRGA